MLVLSTCSYALIPSHPTLTHNFTFLCHVLCPAQCMGWFLILSLPLLLCLVLTHTPLLWHAQQGRGNYTNALYEPRQYQYSNPGPPHPHPQENMAGGAGSSWAVGLTRG